ncbi:MAG: hypothetical protein HZB26_24545 [Candidatus Hydrogenedentes bacterium]|nr:hypothetical protein [Candidatus Hydrogenedentota bacterium]
MNRVFLAVVLGVLCGRSFAYPFAQFKDTTEFVERAPNIVIAECLAVTQTGDYPDEVKLNVLKTIKGDAKSGSVLVAYAQAMEPHARYMVSDAGGQSKFWAVGELCVVPLPAWFNIDELTGKDPAQQVRTVFDRCLFELEWRLAPALQTKTLLEKAINDPSGYWDVSYVAAKLGELHEATSERDGDNLSSLNIQGKPLRSNWHNPVVKEGALFFANASETKPSWEFSPSRATNLEELAGKPLQIHFFGAYSPGLPVEIKNRIRYLGFGKELVMTKPEGNRVILVTSGHVYFARHVDDPRTVFALEFADGHQTPQKITVRYAVVSD